MHFFSVEAEQELVLFQPDSIHASEAKGHQRRSIGFAVFSKLRVISHRRRFCLQRRKLGWKALDVSSTKSTKMMPDNSIG